MVCYQLLQVLADDGAAGSAKDVADEKNAQRMLLKFAYGKCDGNTQRLRACAGLRADSPRWAEDKMGVMA
jgi:hypothetical protein